MEQTREITFWGQNLRMSEDVIDHTRSESTRVTDIHLGYFTTLILLFHLPECLPILFTQHPTPTAVTYAIHHSTPFSLSPLFAARPPAGSTMHDTPHHTQALFRSFLSQGPLHEIPPPSSRPPLCNRKQDGRYSHRYEVPSDTTPNTAAHHTNTRMSGCGK